MEKILKEEYIARYVAKIVEFDPCAIDYAYDAANVSWDEGESEWDTPEGNAETDISYWEE